MEIKYKSKKKYNSINTFLKAKKFSDTLISLYKKNNHMVKVNGETLNTLSPIKKNSIIAITLPNETNKIPLIEKPLNIVYEDNFYLIINKPVDLASSPTRAHILNNVSGMIANYFKDNRIKSKVHLVNRLDKETSGLMIVAKHQYFHALMADAKIIKKYRVLVDGLLKPTIGTIEKNITKQEGNKKRIEDSDGSISITKYKVKKYFKETTSVEAQLVTGRTHQLRLHFSLLGHPIVGDSLYGKGGGRLHLQSYYLKFKHPIYQKTISVKLKKEW